MEEKIVEFLEKKDYSQLKKFLEEANLSDVSEILNELPKDKAVIVFRLLNKDDSAEVFSRLEPDMQEDLINAMSDQELSGIMNDLFLDDAADLVSEMPSDIVKRLLKNTNVANRKYINEILKYPEDSAGSLMNPEYISLKEDMTVRQSFDRIRERGNEAETINTLYVLDPSRKLVGVVSVRDLLLARMTDKISEVMEDNVITIPTTTDKEEVAKMFDKYDYQIMPVVDKEDRLVGIITIDDAMDVAIEEHEEDFEIMAGVIPSEDSYFKTSVFQHAKNRIVWLLVLMLSAIFTGTILTRYEEAFAVMPILVSFIPMIMDTGGNSGSQASTMIIRGLATDEIETKDVLKVWFKEIRIALIVGAVLAVVNGGR
ncbi:MAG: magnesium transporter, partial [Erysipelotrichaceae bacterium]|nr:magnesium transporter [Erysipelotrichaceae bacterium]